MDPNVGGGTSIRVSENLRSRLAQHAGRLTAETGRRVSMADAVEDLLRRAESETEPKAEQSTGTPAHEATATRASNHAHAMSQTVTDADVARGQIRFPRSAKALLPSERCEMVASLKGVVVPAMWDPRLGPDRERSGVLRVDRDHLRQLVDTGGRLTAKLILHLE